MLNIKLQKKIMLRVILFALLTTMLLSSCLNAVEEDNKLSSEIKNSPVTAARSLVLLGRVKQDTLPAELLEALFRSDYYKSIEHEYGVIGGIRVFVVPNVSDSLIHFQLSINKSNRVEPIKNLRYSTVSNLVYEYDVFTDGLKMISGV